MVAQPDRVGWWQRGGMVCLNIAPAHSRHWQIAVPPSFFSCRSLVSPPPPLREHPFLEAHVVVRIVQYVFPLRCMLCLRTRRKVIPEARRATERYGTRLGSLRESTMLPGAANCPPPAGAGFARTKSIAECRDADVELPILPSSLSRRSSIRWCWEREAGRGTLYSVGSDGRQGSSSFC